MKKNVIFFILLFISLSSSSFALSKDELDEQIATLINLNGFLCAKVVNVTPLAQENVYEVRCIEYRGGSGTVDYIMNALTGVVYKR